MALRIISLLLLASCAELRKGWVRVDFVDGSVPKVGVCAFHVKVGPGVGVSSDIEAECRSVQAVRKQLEENQKSEHSETNEL
jgi:hypothetical protein